MITIILMKWRENMVNIWAKIKSIKNICDKDLKVRGK